MTFNEFVKLAAKLEGKKRQAQVAQMREAYKVANKILKGKFYALIKEAELPSEEKN